MKTLILTWWTSTEREVSIRSARFFQKFLPDHPEILYLPEDLEALLQMRHEIERVIPVFHGQYGEDGMIFAFLKTLGIKTAFSDFETHAICLDKYKTNILVESIHIHCPKQILVSKTGTLDEKMITESIGFPCIIKPNTGGSSFFTYKIQDFSELTEKLEYIFSQTNEAMLVCEYILWDEYSVSLVDREVLPIMKIEKVDTQAIFDYASKYEHSGAMRETWPEMPEKEVAEFSVLAKKLYDFFDIKGFCRIDFIKRDNEIFFLEINTIPGMTEASILPQSWQKTGRSFEDLVETIIH